MLDLPDWARPSDVQPYPIDFGLWLKPATGAEELRVDRKGGRFGAKIVFPAMPASDAASFISRFVAACFGETLRVPFPLLDLPQGSPGAPVVDGAGQAGTTIALRGLTPGYAVREGYWLTFVDENGRGYLHNNRVPQRVAADGTVALTVAPEVRWPFADGATVLLAKPTIEGRVTGEPWQLPVDRRVRVGFTLEEVA
ncbi:MAG: hypothetical protein J2O44_07770 [Porphyrobacter sp.]|nr:hypothetical protein [Porphyrobacter sp.]